jgi:hypothetical protein
MSISNTPNSGLKFRVQSSDLRMQGLGFRMFDLGFHVEAEGLGIKIHD